LAGPYGYSSRQLGRGYAEVAHEFVGKLARATAGRFQVTKDGFKLQRWAIHQL
jgi:hypothetical protein